MAIKFIASALIVCGIISSCSGSAIPMWEFLTRDEKMSHLYSMFGKLVSDWCKANNVAVKLPVAQCKHDLFGYGTNQLQRMSDSQLDNMDIFQRDAPELIWDAVMRNNSIVKSVHIKFQPSATTILPLLPTTSSSAAIILINPNRRHQNNPLFEGSDEKDTAASSSSSSAYAMGMDAAYGNHHQHQQQQQPHQPQNQLLIHSAGSTVNRPTYLTGPLVIRVKPDGTPVEEDKNKPLPYDDDREVIAIGRARYFNGPHSHHLIKQHQQQEEQAYQLKAYKNSKNYRTIQRH